MEAAGAEGQCCCGAELSSAPTLASGSMDKAQLCPAPGSSEGHGPGGAVAHPGTEVLSCAARKSSSEERGVTAWRGGWNKNCSTVLPLSSTFHLAHVSYSQISVGQLNWQVRLVFPAGTFDNWTFISEDLSCGNTITSMEILFSPLIITVP